MARASLTDAISIRELILAVGRLGTVTREELAEDMGVDLPTADIFLHMLTAWKIITWERSQAELSPRFEALYQLGALDQPYLFSDRNITMKKALIPDKLVANG